MYPGGMYLYLNFSNVKIIGTLIKNYNYHEEQPQTLRLRHGTHQTLLGENELRIQGKMIRRNRGRINGFTSITGSGQPIHRGSRISRLRVRIPKSHQLTEIHRRHGHDLVTMG